MQPIAIAIIQLVAQYGPGLVKELVTLAHSTKEPTDADWHALLDKFASKSYDDYMNAANAQAAPQP